jgi:hypothetical protein
MAAILMVVVLLVSVCHGLVEVWTAAVVRVVVAGEQPEALDLKLQPYYVVDQILLLREGLNAEKNHEERMVGT